MTEIMTGGCQCGRIRYTALIASDDAYLCHCRMCQRATGGVAAAFVNVPKSSVTWHDEPDWYASSPIAQRPFCSKCGTPLGFSFPDGPNIDLTIGSFDDPSRFSPTTHFGAESLYEAWLDTRELPRSRCKDNPKLVERWAKVGMNVPD
jgi:hypothetical protein